LFTLILFRLPFFLCSGRIPTVIFLNRRFSYLGIQIFSCSSLTNQLRLEHIMCSISEALQPKSLRKLNKEFGMNPCMNCVKFMSLSNCESTFKYGKPDSCCITCFVIFDGWIDLRFDVILNIRFLIICSIIGLTFLQRKTCSNDSSSLHLTIACVLVLYSMRNTSLGHVHE